MDVLRASRSSATSNITNKSDRVKSYMESGAHVVLNADADSFVPCDQEEHEEKISVKNVPESKLIRSEERKRTVDVESQLSQQRQPKLEMAHNTQPHVFTSQLVGEQSFIPVAGDCSDLLSIMSRQNDITVLLVQQQNLSLCQIERFKCLMMIFCCIMIS